MMCQLLYSQKNNPLTPSSKLILNLIAQLTLDSMCSDVPDYFIKGLDEVHIDNVHYRALINPLDDLFKRLSDDTNIGGIVDCEEVV